MKSSIPCVACDKKDNNGIFKCEGCSQRFCLTHTNEHREFLNNQLDQIIIEHENLLNTLNDNKQQFSLLFDQINTWEHDSIIKIQQTAREARVQTKRLDHLEKENTKEKVYQLANQLTEARAHDGYLEKDLYRAILMLEQFKYDITNLSPSIILHQDTNQTLINKILISKINQSTISNENLISHSDQIQIDDNHHLAMHCGPFRGPAYISGTKEYSSGQHHIRLFLSKTTNDFILSFNIMSKFMQMPPALSNTQYLSYGWQSDDCINPSFASLTNEKHVPDLKGKTKFHIELFIDCDNQIISYHNEITKRKRDMKVEIEKCPLPWKLYFYLYDVGDCVRLLSSSEII